MGLGLGNRLILDVAVKFGGSARRDYRVERELEGDIEGDSGESLRGVGH